MQRAKVRRDQLTRSKPCSPLCNPQTLHTGKVYSLPEINKEEECSLSRRPRPWIYWPRLLVSFPGTPFRVSLRPRTALLSSFSVKFFFFSLIPDWIQLPEDSQPATLEGHLLPIASGSILSALKRSLGFEE
ncbi:unnamed protein product [Knipowitschia caucasica]|uniref:Uncharacterized protein n=1 Tax=Knipowitschia caucasica TaxID=637954 RepID=A0AAV2M974_KNICA